MGKWVANSVDPDQTSRFAAYQTPRFVTFDLGLHFLLRPVSSNILAELGTSIFVFPRNKHEATPHTLKTEWIQTVQTLIRRRILRRLIWVFIVCFFFVLRIYGPVNPMGSCRARSVYFTTLFIGQAKFSKRFTSIVHIEKLTTALLESEERMTVENNARSISTKESCRPGWSRTRNFLVTSRTRIQLSHRGRLHYLLRTICPNT